ncbi:MAG: hypothetical protein C0481_04435 [Phenylobacterium sp.]|uniref:hypothetical protein n=1 Tax=Phenylobacterium sp. TaxID=1871053 RepID=UPI0025D3D931|nr:hypothetical protein [Phenylobacterium sp.]MBA4011094.1 hypothetical protein [Phenylobacterium sp.]
MFERRDAIAARNNAEWCAAVWKAHGLPVERAHGLWFCALETPQFYPNVVTVDPDADLQVQTRFIHDLAGRSAFEFSVKDSFASLPLAEAGLEQLFAATWLWREPVGAPALRDDVRWRRVELPDLNRWERAWRGDDHVAPARTFPDGLLRDAQVHVLGGFDAEDQIIAGAIAYEAAGVIGLTNVFGSRGQALAAVASLLPQRAVVCYEAGGNASAQQRGFDPIGPLVVWSRR